MAKFLARRIVTVAVTLFFVSVVVFAVSEIAPGNIAINTLGNTITRAQEESFNAQNGLDQPALTRYRRWMLGSQSEAQRNIGKPLVRLLNEKTRRQTWWIDEGGELYQHVSLDGETMIRLVRQPDGSTVEVEESDSVWSPDENGVLHFWGVASGLQGGRAAMWIKGQNLEEWNIGKNRWNKSLGAPVSYIPLQKGLLRGDPGVSFFTRRPVGETLMRRAKHTGILAGLAFTIMMPLALVFGLYAGMNEGKFADRFASISSLVATATPEYASGTFLIVIFSFWLGLVPGAVVITDDTALFRNPEMLILPVLTLTLIETGYVLRVTRASMVDVMRTDYIRTAVLKGLPRWQVVFRHATKNALMAPITVIMLHVNWLIGGIVVVETVFGFPGLGAYILSAALFKDVYAIEAAAMLLVIIAVTTQLVADIVYTYLNPRIRYA